jgi:hypothetical protein
MLREGKLPNLIKIKLEIVRIIKKKGKKNKIIIKIKKLDKSFFIL